MPPTSLRDIPGEVFETCLLQHFHLNELLRLRRVCTWAKHLSEDYLRSNPRPYVKIIVTRSHNLARGDDDDSEAEQNEPIRYLLEKDNLNSITLPSSKFEISAVQTNPFEHPLLSNFLVKYGNQVRRLQVGELNLPMAEHELKFYEAFPRLKHLNVQVLQNRWSVSPLHFPSTFKDLRSLTIQSLRWENQIPAKVWDMFEFCKKLERLPIPYLAKLHRRVEIKNFLHVHLKSLAIILDKKEHKLLQVLDLSAASEFFDVNEETMPFLSDLLSRHNLKLVNLSGTLLKKLEKFDHRTIAERVWSLNKFSPAGQDFKGIPLPNVQKINKLIWQNENLGSMDFQKMNKFRPEIFPGLMKLEIVVIEGGKFIEYIWHSFPNLEEITFSAGSQSWKQLIFKRSKLDCSDETFIGSNVDKPAFLELKNLRKLTLHVSSGKDLTDFVFHQVFRHMPLREFHLTSKAPLRQVTSEGIRELLTGPFMETIEVFPFNGWSLKDLDNDGFRELGRLFPNNQPL